MNLDPQQNINLHNKEGFEVSFKKAGHAVLIENVQRAVTYVNQLFCDLFGIKLPPSTLLHSSTTNNAKGFSLQFIKNEAFYNSLQQLPSEPFENEIWELRNGKKIVRSFSPFYNKNILCGYVWLFEDYTNHQVLITNTNNDNILLPYEEILNAIPHEIAVFNTQHNFEFINKAYINSSSKRAWAIGKNIEQYFSYDNLPLHLAHQRMKSLHNVWQFKKAISIEEATISSSLNKEYYLRSFIPILSKEQKIHLVLEMATNITNTKKLEIKLEQVTQQFFNTLNSCGDLILHTTDDLKLQFINNSFKTFLGNKAKTSVNDVFSLKQHELYKKIFTVLMGDVSQNTGKIDLKSPDGKEKRFKYNLLPHFNVDDENNGILITLNDITAQQQHEDQLLQLVKREKELNELKTAFVNMVSHELRTPLTVISSSAEILELLLDMGKPKEEITIHTKQIIDEVEKMTAFMQDLLMVSKIEAGKIDLNAAETNINSFVQQVIQQQFSPYKDGRSCTITTKRLPKNAMIDAKMIGHVLQNLLQNAFKYSPLKNAPQVRVAYSNSYFTISIVDEGIGVPKQDVAQLFTSFYRASNVSNISGTGIGLIVVKYFTEQHKGNIFVKSIANKGSIFTLKIPYNQ